LWRLRYSKILSVAMRYQSLFGGRLGRTTYRTGEVVQYAWRRSILAEEPGATAGRGVRTWP